MSMISDTLIRCSINRGADSLENPPDLRVKDIDIIYIFNQSDDPAFEAMSYLVGHTEH